MYRQPNNMHKVLSLVLRRMRAPLLVLICAYTISILGMTLVPGVDDKGEVWYMDFFHAFYFVSYMATTIGFGEIPYNFSEAQRMWTIVCIYLGVITWIYAIGKILALIQDPAFRRAVTENHFRRQVKRMHEPFYLVCGYGDTGRQVIRALTHRNLRAVVIDVKQDPINDLLLQESSLFVSHLCSDAGEPENLRAAGLESPYCAGVLALTNNDQTNLKIAIAGKLLNPDLTVVCRAESRSVQNNMASFGTDHIINPFEAFANQLAIALYSPEMHQIFEWLTALPGTPLTRQAAPPHGMWIICGYGRFGKAVHKYLQFAGLPTTIVEANPAEMGCYGRCIEGRGTEAVTLRAAHIEQAVGIVAGTEDDADNLSILMTAQDLNPNLYRVARQNKRSNDVIFKAADIDLVMQHSSILTLKIMALVTSPLLSDFLRLARRRKPDWIHALTKAVKKISDGRVPDVWVYDITDKQAPAVMEALGENRDIRLGHLLTDPRNRDETLHCLPLLIKRGEELLLRPSSREQIIAGDRVLLCGRHDVPGHISWTLNNLNALRYIETGETRPDGYIWRRFAREVEPNWPKALDERETPR